MGIVKQWTLPYLPTPPLLPAPLPHQKIPHLIKTEKNSGKLKSKIRVKIPFIHTIILTFVKVSV